MKRGDIVCSLSGHDKGRYSVVVNVTEQGVLICDGKHRRILKPKCKNPKHLKPTGFSVAKIESDKSIRKGIFAEFSAYKEEL